MSKNCSSGITFNATVPSGIISSGLNDGFTGLKPSLNATGSPSGPIAVAAVFVTAPTPGGGGIGNAVRSVPGTGKAFVAAPGAGIWMFAVTFVSAITAELWSITTVGISAAFVAGTFPMALVTAGLVAVICCERSAAALLRTVSADRIRPGTGSVGNAGRAVFVAESAWLVLR